MDECRIPIMGFRTDFLSHVKIMVSGKFSEYIRINLSKDEDAMANYTLWLFAAHQLKRTRVIVGFMQTECDIYIRHCWVSNSQPVPFQVRADS